MEAKMTTSMDRTIRVRDGTLVYRHGAGRTWEILDIVVTQHRRMGTGREMIHLLLENARELGERGPAMLYAITRWSNTIAQQFYEALGFRVLGRLHRFYGEDREDAIVYGLDL